MIRTKRRISIIVIFALVLTLFSCRTESRAAPKMTLNKTRVKLQVGKTVRLKIKHKKKNRKKVKWSSSNKKVATVSAKGVVRAKKKGTAKVTAKIGKRRLKCKVSVEENTSLYPKKVLELVNRERKAVGQKQLKLDDALCRAAAIRAKEITSVFSHTRPNGSSCFTVVDEMGITYGFLGENIAMGQKTPAAVMSSWMKSKGHRENILSESYHRLGVGYVKTGKTGGHWVQLFAD